MSIEERSQDPAIRRAQRVLAMVGELHKRGFQRLRISPGMSPSGLHWRCEITCADNTLSTQAVLVDRYDEGLVATYSSAQENEYFGWSDAKAATARQLASLFVERFPLIVERARGEDWSYAGWFAQVLGVAESGHLPVAYSDWEEDALPGRLLTISADGPSHRVTLPVPPAIGSR